MEKREAFWEILLSGADLGTILFAGAVMGLWIFSGPQGMEILMDRLGLIFLIYLVAGWLLQFLKHLPEMDLSWLRGMAFMYWYYIILFLLLLLARFLPDYLRYMVLSDAVVLFGRWVLNYLYVKRTANQLNMAKGGRTLVIDLKDKPGTKEEFFSVLEDYCIKNRLSLEYVKREIPAVVKLDGVLHEVDLRSYYTYGGAIYTMDITKL
ncbi:DUF4318 domain-containing protein [Lacrimispora saccharolytica]|nr:DUF4318 domain-containing protein [Lacrimispora saccharolytica]QRV20904.1 DUF4318 domain-containing protein [Lacrimispora saccharolytica]